MAKKKIKETVIDNKTTDPRREPEEKDRKIIPEGKTNIANLPETPIHKEVDEYEE